MFTVLWLSLLFLAYTFVGYPVVMASIARFRPRPICKSERPRSVPAGSASVVIAMHNESERAVTRIQNLLDTDFPAEQIEVIAVSDGSTDTTAVTLADFARRDPRVKPITLAERSGKPEAINAAAGIATGEFVVFADARQQFDRQTIPQLIANFADPGVGAVSGELHIARSAAGTGAGGDLYWRLEKWTRLSESRSGSVVGCTGAVYAIRRSLIGTLPKDTILDDVVVPMEISRKGYRVVFEPAAVATDPQPLSPSNEMRRKTRTLAGNFQMLFRYPSWINPLQCKLWWRVISHKYCRLAAPVALVLAYASSAFLAFGTANSPIGELIFWMQSVLYALALIGIIFPKAGGKLCAIPAAFVFLNLLTVNGFLYFLSRFRTKHSGWS